MRARKVAVVGGGAWGTALADLLCRHGNAEQVCLWLYEADLAARMARDRVNQTYLPGHRIHERLQPSYQQEPSHGVPPGRCLIAS